jgi:hypothetical protein
MTKRSQPRDLPSTPAAMPWDATHGSYLSGRAHLDGVAHLAAAMEAYWGVDRLRLLVTAELREKFDRQRSRLQRAIGCRNGRTGLEEGGTLDSIIEECRRTTTALNALDANARAAGAIGCPSTVWEVVLKDGSVAAIVQDDGTAKDVVAAQRGRERPFDGRQVSVWTLEEIARLLDHHGEVVKAKSTFPGATVTATRKSVPDPLDDIPHPGDFNDPLSREDGVFNA